MEQDYRTTGTGTSGNGGQARLKTSRRELQHSVSRNSSESTGTGRTSRRAAESTGDGRSARRTASNAGGGRTVRRKSSGIAGRSTAGRTDQRGTAGTQAAMRTERAGRTGRPGSAGTQTAMRTERAGRTGRPGSGGAQVNMRTERVRRTEGTGSSGHSRQNTAGTGRTASARTSRSAGTSRNVRTARPEGTARTVAEQQYEQQRVRAAQQRREKEHREKQLKKYAFLIVLICIAVAAAVTAVSISNSRKRRAAAEQAAAEAQVAAEAEARAKAEAEEKAKKEAEEAAEAAKPISVEEAIKIGPAMSEAEVTGRITEMEREGYPKSLITLFRTNDEARKFVMDYADNKDKHPVIDLSEEVQKGTIPHFVQWDERWGYEMYGDDIMGLNGCGPTCLSMVYCGLTGRTDLNPYALASKAESQGYYVEEVGTAWELMTTFAEGIGLTSEEDMYSAEGLIEELKAGHPTICAVGSGDFTVTGHFIVLHGVNSDGTVKLYDPNSCKLSDKSWDIDEILGQTRDMWTFSYDPNKKASVRRAGADPASDSDAGETDGTVTESENTDTQEESYESEADDYESDAEAEEDAGLYDSYESEQNQ